MDVFGLAWVCHKELPILNQQYVKTKWWYDNDFSCVYVDNHRSNKYFKGNSQSFQNMVFRLRVNEWMCFFNWIFLKIKWLFSVSEKCVCGSIFWNFYTVWKVFVFGILLVRIFRIWTEYGEIHIQSKCGKIRTRKTPNTDTFHAVSGECSVDSWTSWFLGFRQK